MYINLDGFFMKSELELALHLAYKESKNLLPGFKVIMDISNLRNNKTNSGFNLNWIRHSIMAMGGGLISLTGKNMRFDELYAKTVGFYAYENA
jgi:hypothetical protein